MLLVKRLQRAFVTPPKLRLIATATHMVVFMTVAIYTGFATYRPFQKWNSWLMILAETYLTALIEETVFRGCLLPHKGIDGPIADQTLWYNVIQSTAIFVIFHFSPLHRPKEVFRDKRFMLLAGLLGMTTALVYMESGSIWTVTMIHHMTTAVWILILNGHEKIEGLP